MIHGKGVLVFVVLQLILFFARYGVVEVDKKCVSCLFPLLTRAFYIFPCHHAFHEDCLVDEVRQLTVFTLVTQMLG